MVDETEDNVVDEAEVDKANEAEADEANEADEADEADKADESDESDDANEVDEANEAKKANEAGKADKAEEADEVDEAGVSIEMPLLLPFSLTKYPAIFAEVKGSFGVNYNQLSDDVRGRPYDGNEIDNQLGIGLMCWSNSSIQNWWQQRI